MQENRAATIVVTKRLKCVKLDQSVFLQYAPRLKMQGDVVVRITRKRESTLMKIVFLNLKSVVVVCYT